MNDLLLVLLTKILRADSSGVIRLLQRLNIIIDFLDRLGWALQGRNRGARRGGLQGTLTGRSFWVAQLLRGLHSESSLGPAGATYAGGCHGWSQLLELRLLLLFGVRRLFLSGEGPDLSGRDGASGRHLRREHVLVGLSLHRLSCAVVDCILTLLSRNVGEADPALTQLEVMLLFGHLLIRGSL